MSLIVNFQLSGSGKPESVFIAWLLWQPRDADLAVEAIKELNRLAPYEDRIRTLSACDRCSSASQAGQRSCTSNRHA